MINWIYSFFSAPDAANKPETIVAKSLPHPVIHAPQYDNLVDLDTLKFLSGDIEAKNEAGNTPLILAAAENNHQAIAMLFKRGAKLETRGNNGYTALNVAVQEGQVQAAAMLISLGADLESRVETEMGTTEGGATPLWNAVKKNQVEIVRLLIVAGANVNVLDGNGNSVLAFAVHGGNYKIVDMLLKAHADPLLARQGAMNAIERAKADEQTVILKLLEGRMESVEFVRQKRLQYRYFDGQSLYNPKSVATDESINNHLTVTRPTLI